MDELKQRPILTIAIPTYNGQKTIRNTFDSVLKQYDERVEILVVDNCSNDGTPIIIEEYLARYPFIRSIRNENNIGPDRNFLKAMQNSRGKYVLLLSDDDIMIENTLKRIVDFLEKKDMGLVYLHTVSFHENYSGVENCVKPGRDVPKDICTTERSIFMKYAAHYWGFMSSFICSTDRVKNIQDAEQYFGTYWLQSYIHILCVSNPEDKLGVIHGPCIGAGAYLNVSNFDTSLVDGVFYKKMLNFAVEKGHFDEGQLKKLFINRICIQGKRAVIKERASGIKKTSIKRLFRCTYMYPKAWIALYPFFLVPNFLCKFIMKQYRSYRRVSGEMRINRPE